LVISLLLLVTGLIKRSYESATESCQPEPEPETNSESPDANHEPQFNDRLEVCREIIFLLPIIACSVAAYWLVRQCSWWVDFSQHPVIAGLLGSLWGYFVGCAVVWATRIFGTLAFGKEAMGLGDVHLMGAAGAVIGPAFVVVAFFIAPFFGLTWVGLRMFFKKTRQIPYGPFLSLGVFAVMILHDRILDYLSAIFCR
jgi:leader peptidase (prepilin peptidase)/N-methyltransferase